MNQKLLCSSMINLSVFFPAKTPNILRFQFLECADLLFLPLFYVVVNLPILADKSVIGMIKVCYYPFKDVVSPSQVMVVIFLFVLY